MNIFMGYSCTELDISRVKQTIQSLDFDRRTLYTNNSYGIGRVSVQNKYFSTHQIQDTNSISSNTCSNGSISPTATITTGVTAVVMVAVGGMAGKGRNQRLALGSNQRETSAIYRHIFFLFPILLLLVVID
jgi:hypothetical protein